MSPLKRLALPRNPKKIEEKRLNSRRTSLNVNLSYVSDPSISAEEGSPKERVENVDSAPMESRRVQDDKKTDKTEIPEEFLHKIKPSFVRLTSTPIPSKYATLLVDKKPSNDRSSSKRQRRFSEVSTIILETSMDITEVQGGPILAINDSVNFIPDTQPSEFVENSRTSVVIPDSEPDASVDTVRISMNVNTSLDSQAVNPNLRKNLIEEDLLQRDRETGPRERKITSDKNYRKSTWSISSSSTGNEIPTNSFVVTRAVVERENSPSSGDSRQTVDGETVVEAPTERRFDTLKNPAGTGERKSGAKENRKENESEANENSDEERSEPPVGTPVRRKEICSTRLDYSSDNSGSESAASSSSSRSVLRRESPGKIYQRIINSGLNKSRNLLDKSEGKKVKKKKKLMRLHTSEIVDLSPVSVKLIRPTNNLIFGKRPKRKNKAAKKVVKKKSEIRKKKAASDEDDEIQTEAEPTPKKKKRVIKIKAKKIVIKKLRDVELRRLVNNDANPLRNDRSDEEENDEEDLSGNEFRGNSLDDFEPKNDLTQRKTGRISRPTIIIVASGLPVEQKKLVKEAVARLGSSKLQQIVSRHTTHVVSNGVRTVNMLRGIIRGCWVVNIDWISRSREAGKWLDAEAFEMKKFSEAVEKNRREKQLFKAAYISELFLTCGSVHISKGTSIPVAVLEELVRLAGGRVAPDPKNAKIIVGRGGLKEVWILDSITHGELQPFERYSKKKSSSQ